MEFPIIFNYVAVLAEEQANRFWCFSLYKFKTMSYKIEHCCLVVTTPAYYSEIAGLNPSTLIVYFDDFCRFSRTIETNSKIGPSLKICHRLFLPYSPNLSFFINPLMKVPLNTNRQKIPVKNTSFGASHIVICTLRCSNARGWLLGRFTAVLLKPNWTRYPKHISWETRLRETCALWLCFPAQLPDCLDMDMNIFE